jgi:hypothetical protein
MITFLSSVFGRMILGAAGIGIFLALFAYRDHKIEQRGYKKAATEITKATHEKTSLAKDAGRRSRAKNTLGVTNPYYRD